MFDLFSYFFLICKKINKLVKIKYTNVFLFEEIANRMKKEKKKETIKQLLTYNERFKINFVTPEKKKKFCINSQKYTEWKYVITVSCTYLDLNGYSTWESQHEKNYALFSLFIVFVG